MPEPGAVGVIGLDVGGTTIKGGVLGAGAPRSVRRVPSCREAGPDAVVAAVGAAVDGLLADAAAGGVEVGAVGLAVLGIVDEDAGVARASAAVGWQDVPLRRLVAQRCGGRPVAFGHDVRTAAVAEATLGAGRAYRHVLFVALGTGLSLAQVVDGRPVSGETWRAGEIGQLHGLESVASGRGMASRLDQRLLRPAGTSSAAELFGPDAASRDHRLVVDGALDALAAPLATAVTLADPGVIVVGGGVALAGEALLAPLRERLAQALDWREPPPVVGAAFADDAAWIGAALAAWRLAEIPALFEPFWSSGDHDGSKTAPTAGTAP